MPRYAPVLARDPGGCLKSLVRVEIHLIGPYNGARCVLLDIGFYVIVRHVFLVVVTITDVNDINILIQGKF